MAKREKESIGKLMGWCSSVAVLLMGGHKRPLDSRNGSSWILVMTASSASRKLLWSILGVSALPVHACSILVREAARIA